MENQRVLLLCAPCVLYLLGCMWEKIRLRPGHAIEKVWREVIWVSLMALICATVSCVFTFAAGPFVFRGMTLVTLGRFGAGILSFRTDAVGALMLLLVSFLGWVIVCFSRQYMAGDPEQGCYVRKLMQTLSAVSLLVVTNNLIIFLAAWILTSLSLHGLLTLYRNREPAIIAAHKKFLASRLGDLALMCAVGLLGSVVGSLEIDQVVQRTVNANTAGAPFQIAATLLAISALIKCAQLPLHGWLIQVMEAPTPISALLHAGVVNLGGFMLIRMAAVIELSVFARTLLVVVGCTTAGIASLVMMTRISIKVHLAWSTSAQMGFMLLECGLGLYDLAFLHLLAHSLYKAYAFLSSGDVVRRAKVKKMLGPLQPPGTRVMLAGGALGVVCAACAAWLWQPYQMPDYGRLFAVVVVGLATTLLLVPANLKLPFSVLPALGISSVYFGYHRLFGMLVPAPIPGEAGHVLYGFSMAFFVMLFVTQTVIYTRPYGRFASALYPWFYAGLYLDELFTRATFWLWPARVPERRKFQEAIGSAQ